ncbi:uncharacterized protein PHACADRAFT_201673 [Phanerochaete carnosa HHB-10118-sp]|uniref:Uncharacterized protein n=1 Tax=Phanerochaete carnosa (strain HHB-10118-sp) TaxID=650164 RepID=K5UIR5_PHACS|nr:uncharacterized protein PHACADRAFT_201673 [Phanerochaete carnosa HHB-10118-sp]EKM49411.1 hypothetical protein PHACADRAFT_201673 [Phanerochaete carnosa HHB-10118-sp]
MPPSPSPSASESRPALTSAPAHSMEEDQQALRTADWILLCTLAGKCTEVDGGLSAELVNPQLFRVSTSVRLPPPPRIYTREMSPTSSNTISVTAALGSCHASLGRSALPTRSRFAQCMLISEQHSPRYTYARSYNNATPAITRQCRSPPWPRHYEVCQPLQLAVSILQVDLGTDILTLKDIYKHMKHEP